MAFDLIKQNQFEEFRYEIYLCESSHPYNVLGDLGNSIKDINFRWVTREPDELNFVIEEKFEDGTLNSLFDDIVETKTIKVEEYINDFLQETYLYHINNVEPFGDIKNSKSIKAYSLEMRLNKKAVRDFNYSTNIYTGTTWDSDNPDTSGILDYIIELFDDNWSVSYVDPTLLNSLRRFDITQSKVLEVVRLIEDNFNCIFLYSTANQSIIVLSVENINLESNIILDSKNYIEQYNSQIDVDDIITRLYIEGNSNIGISSVNITGTNYIDDFSFFMNTKYMTQGLIDALTTLNSLRSSNVATYEGYLATLSTKQGELFTLQSELFDLNTELIILEDKQDLAIRNGGSYSGKNYSEWGIDITAKQGEITTKEGEITTKEGEISAVNSDIDTLQYSVSYDNPANLTNTQRKELVNFIQEGTQKINSDEPSTLLALGEAYLAIKSQAQYEINVNMVDVFSCKSESYTWPRIDLFTKVNLVINDEIYNPIITSITHGYDSNSLSITVSNKLYFSDDMDYLTALWAKTNQISKVVDANEISWKDTVDKANQLEADAENPINVTDNVINIGDDAGAGLVQQAQITRRGLYTGDSLTANGQMRILSDMIVFTQDTWDTYSVAIDSTGIRTSGSFRLIGDGEFGGNNLVTIDGNGILIYGDETETSGIEIYNKLNQKVLGFDSSGNMTMTGKLTITSGSSGISNLADAGVLATADDLDDVNDGVTYKRTNQNEKTGAGRAYSGLDSSNDLVTRVKPTVSMGTPSSSGLYMGSDYLGFYNSGWKSFIKNDGTFSFTGNGSNYIEWNGSTLTVRGAITADDITAGGTMTGSTIRTASSGARIELTSSDVFRCYNSSNQLHGLYIDPSSFVDLILYKNGSELFKVYDGVTEIELRTYGSNTMLTNNGSTTYTYNTWDFSLATVTGLSVKFA
jgi:hypothetical protein